MTQHVLPILYEDDDVLVIDKPAGLLMHPAADTKEGVVTLVDWIRETHPTIEDVGEPMRLQSGQTIARPGIVHRLDRETSGVLLIAKTKESFASLKAQFQLRETRKIYNAFAWGTFKAASGIIDRPIGRSPSDPRKHIATRGAKGVLREAVTAYTVLKQGREIAYVEVRPTTGRTHQIRAHFLAINHPLVGDTLYAPRRGYALDFTRVALHARSITFTTLAGTQKTVEAPLPPDFEKALSSLVSA